MRPRRGLPAPSQNCKSFSILLIGLCIIAIGVGPRMHMRRFGVERDEEFDDGEDLRRVLKRKVPHVEESQNQDAERELEQRSAVRSERQNRKDIPRVNEIQPEQVERLAREEEAKGMAKYTEEKSKRAKELAQKAGSTGKKPSIHVMLTSNGSPYMNWQTRIMYYTYQQVASQPGSDMKYFTRVLHRMKPDALMDEIHTVRVDPLDPKCDEWCDYPVASRPWAIQQWLDSGDVKGDWIFMIETDYIFIKPVSIPPSGRALGFPFGYIIPTYPTITEVMKRFYPPPGRLEDIPPTGNAPVLAPAEDIRKIVPIWVNVTAAIELDKEAVDKLGWVREMYAFSIATALAKVSLDLPVVPHAIMVQPPADPEVGDAAILHYTWASEVTDEKKKVIWRWDKRKWNYIKGLPPLIKDIPESLSPAVKLLMNKIMEAISALPKYSRGELIEDGLDPNDPKYLKPQVFNETEAAWSVFPDPVQPEDEEEKDEEGSGNDDNEVKEDASTEEASNEEERAAMPQQVASESSSETKGEGSKGEKIHVMLTSNGSPYMNWQTRIMLHSLKKVQNMPGNDMKHFTRVLHRMKEDNMMRDIHTVRVDPLDPKCDTWCDYPVASRPDAINQWLNSGDVQGDWVLMIETDYVFVKPLSVPASGRALGFPFGYIVPTDPGVTEIMRNYYPEGRLEDIPATGNAPVLIRVEDLRKVVPIWVNVTAEIEKDKQAKEVLGWVREMYAFSIAMALAKVPIDLPPVPRAIMVQPPADAILGDAAIIHYTWASILKDDKGNEIWKFDKRDHVEDKLPPHIPDPPAERASDLLILFIKEMNDAIDNAPKSSQ